MKLYSKPLLEPTPVAMHAHLQGLVDDLVEQRGEPTPILTYQHLRLLSKLSALEKVNFETLNG